MKSIIFNIVLLVLVFLLIAGIYYGLITHNQIKNDLDKQISALEDEKNEKDRIIEQTSNDRDTIRDTWEEQAVVNDKIIISQTEALQTLNEFLRILEDSVEISENGLSLISQARANDLYQEKNGLEKSLLELEKATGENVLFKEQAKNRIDEIYLRIGRDQPNRAPTE